MQEGGGRFWGKFLVNNNKYPCAALCKKEKCREFRRGDTQNFDNAAEAVLEEERKPGVVCCGAGPRPQVVPVAS